MATDLQILDLIRRSLGYKLIDPRDKTKVEKALRGEPSMRPSSLIGQAAWELAKRIAPPPPPPAYKKVAPRTFNKVLPNGSDARFCVFGLERNAQGRLYDDVATYDDNGLCWGGRSTDTQVPGLRQANNMDQYGPCDLYPPLTAWPGDPTKNTGSWEI